jgi:hypothetical protein
MMRLKAFKSFSFVCLNTEHIKLKIIVPSMNSGVKIKTGQQSNQNFAVVTKWEISI